jgi:hypothetical protein
MKYVVQKASRPPGGVTFAGRWFGIPSSIRYCPQYDNYKEAVVVRDWLNKVNTMNFEVREVKDG